MQAIYSKSIVEIKTWNDMNDICTDSTTTGERIIIIFMHKYEGMYKYCMTKYLICVKTRE